MRNFFLFQKCKTFIQNNIVIKGTLILILTGIITRIIGFYNRIFLSDLIGATQLGIYQLILPMYMIAFALTNYGNEIALTKLTSEHKGKRDYCSIHAFFIICFLSNILLASLLSIIIYQNAEWICIHILHANNCEDALKIICVGIPFMSMKGCIHGYFLGLGKAGVHGISDFIEQAVKVLSVFIIATFFCIKNQYNVNLALWGVVISDIFAFLYSFIMLRIDNHKNKAYYMACQKAYPTKKQLFTFLSNSIPLTTNRLALTILQGIESIIIPSVLFIYYNDSDISLAHYGIFTGMAFPFIMFPATITNALSTMILPVVSYATSASDTKQLSNLCEKSLHFCLLIGVFSFTIFYIYGIDIGYLFFQNKEAGIYLYQLSFLCPFIYLATTLASIINGLGHANYNLLFTVIATLIRITFIQFFVPNIGLSGYTLGLFISYCYLTTASFIKLQKIIQLPLHFIKKIFIPWFSFILVGSVSYCIFRRIITSYTLSHLSELLLLIGIIGIIAFICVLPLIKIIYKAPQQPH
ncbi:MAG: hypothetical protein E7264_05435 [Lachnospiraceae bacterium]|nr:hypothetical protein [Lachnospiraceae bacterium]